MSKKIIHVLGSMDVGGVETWLMNILKNSDAKKFKHEFLVQKNKKGFYDEKIDRLGSRVHICEINNIFSYTIRAYSKIRKLKPDVVHSHVGAFSGLVLFVSWLAGVECRVSHSHTDLSVTDKKSRLIRKLYINLMKQLIRAFSTDNIAVSEAAASYLYGKNWKTDLKTQIMYCAIDESKFINTICDLDYRAQFDIPKDAIVLGHVGGFRAVKNQAFLIELILELCIKDGSYYLVLVGDGPLKDIIEKQVSKSNLNVKFLGNRTDIAEIMTCLFDIFLFPSHYEGLGLAAVEAQFAGLHVIASDKVPHEADCGNCVFLSLDKHRWINYIYKTDFQKSPTNLDTSRFSLDKNLEVLSRIYSKCK